jgi:Recombination endonuclease VII
MRKPDRRTDSRTKKCRDCEVVKPRTEFYQTTYARKHGTNGVVPACKKCYSKRGKIYYEANTEYMLNRTKEAHKRRVAKDPEKYRRERFGVRLKNVYGITLQEWEKLLEKQDGKCAICCIPLYLKLDGTQDSTVDHNHACCAGQSSCGKCIRGILCVNCNWGLGQFKDDQAILQAAINYLKA